MLPVVSSRDMALAVAKRISFKEKSLQLPAQDASSALQDVIVTDAVAKSLNISNICVFLLNIISGARLYNNHSGFAK
ncbi:hypothetical protein APHDU1_0720 [Anaplasma phagocytophilum]|uniref:Uncharacterized protein n=1 Tax=Anaplasma phagocytophilum (strain HZ) TaxID=212042 RepID=Q2GIC0_ANAPZ|nr:hypothetical protein APH_1382 [Anaplasma phagocytophilum str. HZ]KKA00215.1 hypothetical protein APHDU1_0720 [Anaplasma phagocytophilum]